MTMIHFWDSQKNYMGGRMHLVSASRMYDGRPKLHQQFERDEEAGKRGVVSGVDVGTRRYLLFFSIMYLLKKAKGGGEDGEKSTSLSRRWRN
jgi:hypothetical protein